jgi:hypothetical protein
MAASGSMPGERTTRIPHLRGSATTMRGIGLLALALLLAGCGATTLTARSTSTPTQTTSATPESAANATATAQATRSPASVTNCTSSSPHADSVGHPTYILTATAQSRTVMAHVGDTVQVRLPATSRWSLQAAQSATVLASIAPSGMYAPALNACIWTFQARSTGAETLRYAGAPICKPGQPCAAYRIAMNFSINVS